MDSQYDNVLLIIDLFRKLKIMSLVMFMLLVYYLFLKDEHFITGTSGYHRNRS